MEATITQHRERIIRIGKLLYGFVLGWLILNSIALLLMLAVVVELYVVGTSGSRQTVVDLFTYAELVPGLGAEEIEKIITWDYETFLDHFWLILTLALVSTAYFVTTMILMLRIAKSLKRGELLSKRAIGSLHLLGWIYVIQGVVAFFWGIIGQMVWTSNTCELLYFSFIHDVCNFSFTFSGSGIEWGMLALALSWIAKSFQEEQELIV